MEKNPFLQKNNLLTGATFAFLIIFYVFINFVLGLLFNTFLTPNTAIYQSAYLLTSTLALAVTLITLKVVKKENFVLLVSAKKFSPVYAIIALLISFGMLFGFGKINEIFTGVISKLGFKVSNSSISVNSAGEYVLFLFTVCILPAILEEFIFRGVILFNLKGAGRVFAIFISALCFSLYHLNFSQLIYQFIYGIVLAVLTLASKSVIPAIIAHFTNNFVILTCTYLKVNVNLNAPVLIVLGLIAILVCLVFTILKIKKQKEQKTLTKLGFFIPFGVVGIIASSLVIILGAVC